MLIGINLLREGLDIPECALVAILDADKEGFLRSETSLIQTIGRAARNVDGKVILYADQHHRLDGARDGRDHAPPRQAARLQRRARHHAASASRRTSATSWASMYERDHVMVDTAAWARTAREFIGHNIKAHHRRSGEAHARRRRRPRIRGSRAACATRLKRLQAVELAIADDPFARQSEVDRAVDDAFLSAVRDGGGRHGLAVTGAEASEDQPREDEARAKAECAEDVWE